MVRVMVVYVLPVVIMLVGAAAVDPIAVVMAGLASRCD